MSNVESAAGFLSELEVSGHHAFLSGGRYPLEGQQC